MLTGWLNIEIQKIQNRVYRYRPEIYSAVLEVAIELDEPPKEIIKKEKRTPKTKVLQCSILDSSKEVKLIKEGVKVLFENGNHHRGEIH